MNSCGTMKGGWEMIRKKTFTSDESAAPSVGNTEDRLKGPNFPKMFIDPISHAFTQSWFVGINDLVPRKEGDKGFRPQYQVALLLFDGLRQGSLRKRCHQYKIPFPITKKDQIPLVREVSKIVKDVKTNGSNLFYGPLVNNLFNSRNFQQWIGTRIRVQGSIKSNTVLYRDKRGRVNLVVNLNWEKLKHKVILHVTDMFSQSRMGYYLIVNDQESFRKFGAVAVQEKQTTEPEVAETQDNCIYSSDLDTNYSDQFKASDKQGLCGPSL